MIRSRAALLACLAVSVSGCESTPRLAALFARHDTAVAVERPVVQTQVHLASGMEIQWQAQTSEDQPGQVKNGKGFVGPDGTMVVGPYGTCNVAGMTLDQATKALEQHLALYMKSPSVQLSTTVPANQPNMAWRSAPMTVGVVRAESTAPHVAAAENTDVTAIQSTAFRQ
jgi:hypothetical protein